MCYKIDWKKSVAFFFYADLLMCAQVLILLFHDLQMVQES